MLAKRSSSALKCFAMINFSLEFLAVFWALQRHKFLMLMLLEVRSSVRYLNFTLENTVSELNFNAKNTACYRAMCVHLTHCVARERLTTSPRREATSRRVILLHERFHVVNRVATRLLGFSSKMLSARLLALMMIPC